MAGEGDLLYWSSSLISLLVAIVALFLVGLKSMYVQYGSGVDVPMTCP